VPPFGEEATRSRVGKPQHQHAARDVLAERGPLEHDAVPLRPCRPGLFERFDLRGGGGHVLRSHRAPIVALVRPCALLAEDADDLPLPWNFNRGGDWGGCTRSRSPPR